MGQNDETFKMRFEIQFSIDLKRFLFKLRGILNRAEFEFTIRKRRNYTSKKYNEI